MLCWDTCLLGRIEDLLKEDTISWTPSVFVFEEAQSYLGKEVFVVFVGGVLAVCR